MLRILEERKCDNDDDDDEEEEKGKKYKRDDVTPLWPAVTLGCLISMCKSNFLYVFLCLCLVEWQKKKKKNCVCKMPFACCLLILSFFYFVSTVVVHHQTIESRQKIELMPLLLLLLKQNEPPLFLFICLLVSNWNPWAGPNQIKYREQRIGHAFRWDHQRSEWTVCWSVFLPLFVAII